jgi:hypothetical protein
MSGKPLRFYFASQSDGPVAPGAELDDDDK